MEKKCLICGKHFTDLTFIKYRHCPECRGKWGKILKSIIEPVTTGKGDQK
jgi:DNA-directed RNA polymerase subunit RPC12/RpoP